jgi:hypothetical protein
MNGFDLIDNKLIKFREKYNEFPELMIIGINVYYDVYKYMKMRELELLIEDIERTKFIKEHSNNIGTIPTIKGIPYKISSSIDVNEVVLLGSFSLELQRNHERKFLGVDSM